RGPLSLQRFVLLALFRREERKDALLLRVAQLRHLRALRFGGALQGVEARGVVRLFRGADFLPRRTDLLEERLVLLAKALVEVADLRLLRIREIQFFGETSAEFATTFTAVVAVAFTMRCGHCERRAERDNGCCGEALVAGH